VLFMNKCDSTLIRVRETQHKGKKMKRICFILLCSTLLLLLSIGELILAGEYPKSTRSLFNEAISLLSQTGGVGSFATPPGTPGRTETPLSSEKVGEVLDKVISNLQTVIELDPSIKEAYFFLGVAFVRKMDRDHAVTALYKAMATEPDREMTYVLLCGMLWDAKRYEDALSVASRLAVQIPQSRITAAILAGKTYYEMGDYGKALEEGLGIIDSDRSHLEGRILVASSYYCLGNYEKADDQIKILESDPRIGSQIAEFKNGLKEKCGGGGNH